MIARKQDSDYKITQRMIKREARKLTNKLAGSSKGANFVQNYVYSGSGSGGFGNGGSVATGRTTATMYDPANPGTTYVQTRSKIAGGHGVYLQDNAGADEITINADAVNDPMFWLNGGF